MTGGELPRGWVITVAPTEWCRDQTTFLNPVFERGKENLEKGLETFGRMEYNEGNQRKSQDVHVAYN
jgi:hypothetical protein